MKNLPIYFRNVSRNSSEKKCQSGNEDRLVIAQDTTDCREEYKYTYTYLCIRISDCTHHVSLLYELDPAREEGRLPHLHGAPVVHPCKERPL